MLGGAVGVAVDDPAYGSYLNWLHMSDATLTFPQTLVLRYTHLEPPERRFQLGLGGLRVGKDDPRVAAYGDGDERNPANFQINIHCY